MTLLAGLDLGKRSDHSALAILEQTRAHEQARAKYLVRALKRWPLGEPYTKVIADLQAITSRGEVVGLDLTVDATGCGEAVVEMMRLAQLSCAIRPVLITAGQAVTLGEDGVWRVAKAALASHLVAVAESMRLQFLGGLSLAETAAREMASFSEKVSAAGNSAYLADPRTGKHDDIVLAVALAVWAGETLHVGAWEMPDDPNNRTPTAQAPPGVFDSDGVRGPW